MPPFEVYLFANHFNSSQPLSIRYLYATRTVKEEANTLCKDLNRQITSAEYRVVEVD